MLGFVTPDAIKRVTPLGGGDASSVFFREQWKSAIFRCFQSRYAVVSCRRSATRIAIR